jgi:hypothetical protein
VKSPAPPLAPSSLLFLYAADPAPRSAVCRNQAGSRDESEAAICSLLCSGCSDDASLPPTTEVGREPGRDVGRLCQLNVPDRAKLLALGVGRSAPSVFVVVVRDGSGVEAVADVLTEPNPVNTGTSFVGLGGPACAPSISVDANGVSNARSAAAPLFSLTACRSWVDRDLVGEDDNARSMPQCVRSASMNRFC